jgi:hypothetical protein
MKFRNGFVSNSSSSSFIITTREEISERALMDAFKIAPDTPLFSLTKQIVKYIVDNSTKYDSLEAYKEELGYYDDEYPPSSWKEAFDSSRHVYELRCSNEDGDAISEMLYRGGHIECDTEDIKISSEY